MREKVEQRLKELRAELETGHAQLEMLDAKKTNLEQTLLRITGAVQVLEELLASDTGSRPQGG